MSFTLLNILKNKEVSTLKTLLIFLIVISCSKDNSGIDNGSEGDDNVVNVVTTIKLSQRSGSRPETTTGVPHVQIGVEFVPEINEELFRRVYSIPGIENLPSVIAGWQGLSLTDEVTVAVSAALIGGREFGHIHDDGSLHIFLEPARATEAVETCWAIFHPFALQQIPKWNGFVMLYTPQSIDELNVTFQLIVDAYNHVTGQNLTATDFY